MQTNTFRTKFRMPLFQRGACGALLIVLVMLTSYAAVAQTFSASIAGTVSDPSGAVIAGAKLQLQNMDTKDVRLQNSSGTGGYAFTNLLPGTYQLSISASGFKDYVRRDMSLHASTAANVDIRMEVGNASERVEVSASGAVLLDTASANNSVTLPGVLLQNLPNNTLQPLNFVFALAGTTESQGMTSRSATYDQNFSAFGVNGGRSAESLILIDGAPSTAIDWGGLMVSPIQDSVAEQQVVQNVYDAQYERGGEGVVTLVTRSGSNKFHGEAYDFMRNNGLDANSWWANNNDIARSKFHRNQFGGNIGGPIWQKHNLFFFGAYEGLRQPGTYGTVGSVPTSAERQGDFSNSFDANGKLIVIYNPFSTRQVTDSTGTYYTRDPFPGNKIPSGLINPVGQKIANLYGAPTRSSQGGNDNQNFVKQGADTTTNDKFDWRIDWNQSAKHRLFARMSDRLRQGDVPPCFFCNGADNDYSSSSKGAQVVLNDTITPSPTWVIDTYGAWSRWLEQQTLVGYGKADPSTIGLSKNLFQIPMLPIVNTHGYTPLGNHDSSYVRYPRTMSTGLINVTKQLSRHTLKFGFNYDVSMINNRKDYPGVFNFNGSMTTCEANPGGTACKASVDPGVTGNSIADILLGTGSGYTDIVMDPAFSAHAFGMYLQDDWRVTPRLTISAGLRYENQRPATERHNRIAYFNPKAINPLSTAYGKTLYGAFEYAGTGGRNRDAWEPDNTNFGPRLGLAYRFTDKLLGRLGGGMFYGPASAMLSFDGAGQSPGFNSTTNWIGSQNANGYIPTNLVSNPFPNGLTKPTGNSLAGMTFVGYGASQLWPKIPHPVANIYQWSMDLQYQFSPHAVAEIGYTGVRGRKLMYGNPNIDFDQLPTADLSLGSKLDELIPNPFNGVITDSGSDLYGTDIARYRTLKPYPQYTQLQATRSLPGARSQFDALNMRFDYTFFNGLTSITTYQWSKNLDNGSEALLGWSVGGSWRDSYNTKLDYGLSTRDVPQSFVEAWYYELPYGTARKWGANAPQAVRQIVGGWNVSGAIRLSSGLPLLVPVTWGWNPLGKYGFPGNALPNLVGNPIPKGRSPKNWINADAFQGVSSTGSGLTTCGKDKNCQPFPYSYGNEPQHYNTLREAATKNLDLGISKNFGTERYKVQLRGDFLNAFNHPIYGGGFNWGMSIDRYLGSGSFGTVNGTRNDPRNIQLALKVMF